MLYVLTARDSFFYILSLYKQCQNRAKEKEKNKLQIDCLAIRVRGGKELLHINKSGYTAVALTSYYNNFHKHIQSAARDFFFLWNDLPLFFIRKIQKKWRRQHKWSACTFDLSWTKSDYKNSTCIVHPYDIRYFIWKKKKNEHRQISNAFWCWFSNRRHFIRPVQYP